MDIPLDIEGFTTKNISLRPRGVFSLGPKLILDGQPVAGKRQIYLIPDDTGREIEFRLRHRFWDPIPDLMIADLRMEVVPPLKIYEHAWICLPILLITIGGLLGGACGGVATSFNYSVFRKTESPVMKYSLTALISLCAPVVWIGICLVLVRVFGFGHGTR